jgi:hypothetical protein
MSTNIERYSKDIDKLVTKGRNLFNALQSETLPAEFQSLLKKQYGEKAQEVLKTLPSFRDDYQTWYSEAKSLIRQLLPDRLQDFTSHYEKPKSRKALTYESYRIEDALQGLTITSGYAKEKVVGPDAAIQHFRQQVAILEAVKGRFESSLFDIRQLVQADLFDSELDAAKELARSKFTRAAGALAGVVLERHLAQVCDNHNIRTAKKEPTISELNNTLKDSNVIDIPQWRFIQHLADIRNLCDHKKTSEPTADQVNDLLAGVTKATKTVF